MSIVSVAMSRMVLLNEDTKCKRLSTKMIEGAIASFIVTTYLFMIEIFY